MDNNNIGIRIKTRRKQLGLTLAQVSENTDISTGNLSCIEQGKYLPSANALLSLSQKLNCSIDWILTGNSPSSHNYDALIMNVNLKEVGTRLTIRRKELCLSQTDIYAKCGIPSGTLSRIENGLICPSFINFFKLSQILECDMYWLITGDSISNYTNLSSKELSLLTEFQSLDPNDQNELIDFLNFLLQRAK